MRTTYGQRKIRVPRTTQPTTSTKWTQPPFSFPSSNEGQQDQKAAEEHDAAAASVAAMSLAMRVLATLLPLLVRSPIRTAETARRSAAKRRSDAGLPWSLRRLCHVDTTTVDGRTVITLRPRRGRAPNSATIIYLHGGAYIHPIIRPHWWIIQELIQTTGATVVVPLYRLAPAATASTEYPFVRAVYDLVARDAQGRPVILAGDSAGGGFAIGLAIQLRDAANQDSDNTATTVSNNSTTTTTTLPHALILFSPWVDATMTNPSITPALASHDPMLSAPGLAWCGRAWAGAALAFDAAHPLPSPVNDPARLARLPPLHLYLGARDILTPDAVRLFDLARGSGNDGDLRLYPAAFHDFVIFPCLRESRDVYTRVAAVVRGARRVDDVAAPAT